MILVVDDDPVVRSMLLEVLCRAGHFTAAVANGKAALDLLDQGVRPDVILLDLVMPIMDGRTTLEQLRHRGSLVPVLLVSAFLDDIGANFGSPVVGGLPKPFGHEALIEAVERALDPGP